MKCSEKKTREKKHVPTGGRNNNKIKKSWILITENKNNKNLQQVF